MCLKKKFLIWILTGVLIFLFFVFESSKLQLSSAPPNIEKSSDGSFKSDKNRVNFISSKEEALLHSLEKGESSISEAKIQEAKTIASEFFDLGDHYDGNTARIKFYEKISADQEILRILTMSLENTEWAKNLFPKEHAKVRFFAIKTLAFMAHNGTSAPLEEMTKSLLSAHIQDGSSEKKRSDIDLEEILDAFIQFRQPKNEEDYSRIVEELSYHKNWPKKTYKIFANNLFFQYMKEHTRQESENMVHKLLYKD